MAASRLPLRWCAGVLGIALGISLSGCATQAPTDVRVSVGADLPSDFKAADYAALYAPYAMMATAAYTEPSDFNRANCPDRRRLERPVADRKEAEFRTSVRGWIAQLNGRGWQCDFGVYGALDCPPRAGSKCKPVGGLQFHVWRRIQDKSCREVVIAFRGTDKSDRGDWTSNFRWLYRLQPKFDQYDQVKAHIEQIVDRIKKNGCGAKGIEFATAGHSLGGGLAQQAAYADGTQSIRYVYAFDPSPVTGFFDVSAMLREKSTAGLGVDRAYERGEILTLPRTILENIYPPAPCNPRIRTVRFNLLSGFAVSQHSIAGLTRELNTAARSRAANPRRVNDMLRARGCKGSPMLLVAPPA